MAILTTFWRRCSAATVSAEPTVPTGATRTSRPSMTKAATTSNMDDRTALYQQAQKIFKEQAPWLTIAHTIVSVPMQKKVTGFKIDPLGHFNFEGVNISG